MIGPRPEITRDAEAARDRRFALRLTAREATDAAFEQHIDVASGVGPTLYHADP